MRALWAHVALAVVGVAAVVWALTLAADPVITCRDVVMAPGGVCVNADGDRLQTYDERMAAAQQARPVVGGVGLVVAAFGTALGIAEVRRAGSSGRTRPDRPPAA